MERGARQARRDQARVLPARDRLGVDPALGRGARRAWTSRRAGACARSGRAWAGAACASSCARWRRASARAGWTTLVVFTSTPDWAASPPSGCERPQAVPRARPPRADALPAYRALVEQVLGDGARGGRGADATSAPGTSPTTRRSSARSGRRATRRSPSTAPAAYAQIATRAAAGAGRGRTWRPAARAGRDGGADEVHALRDLGARLHRRAAEGPRLRDDRLEPARLHRRRRPGRAGRRRPRRARAAATRSRSGSPRPASARRPRTSARAPRSPTPSPAAALCTPSSSAGGRTRA